MVRNYTGISAEYLCTQKQMYTYNILRNLCERIETEFSAKRVEYNSNYVHPQSEISTRWELADGSWVTLKRIETGISGHMFLSTNSDPIITCLDMLLEEKNGLS